ncbi:PrgI family protein [Aeriscardovia aeriphila]|uniref:PrgI family protein n=1 Tax=Aeriscardovia aeriphila TaxID=218139 RepID=A0A261FBK8_9BIFI|nr:PrgI family protein [Aeriscardovia aeriphila]NYI25317.1 hypothetical protein [Aeriscardovia aeriphila]OZG56529.1 hypothetical protein AEAE_1017 [Aeriscardovia aeriphila]
MSLSVDCFSDPENIEPKILFGLSFRRLCGVLLMTPPSLGLGALSWFFPQVVTPVVVALGLILIDFPIALWAFPRPMGLLPEQWLVFAMRDYFGARILYHSGSAHVVKSAKKPTMKEK